MEGGGTATALAEEGDGFDDTAVAPAWLGGCGVRREAAIDELQLGSGWRRAEVARLRGGTAECGGSSAQGRHCGVRLSGGRRRCLASARLHLEQAIKVERHRGGERKAHERS
jgi:hypothetical protein